MYDKTINLHPDSNGGQSVFAKGTVENSCANIKLSYQAYGNHQTESTISFYKPEHIRRLAKMLNEMADNFEGLINE